MCGIHVAISRKPLHSLPEDLHRRLKSRGPDHFGQESLELSGRGYEPALFITATSTVLSLRGDHITAQPFVDSSREFVFLWNGEAWKIGGERVRGNDGAALFTQLSGASRRGAQDEVMGILRSIEGPFAFVYVDKSAGLLYYGRDRLGRRSLLQRGDGGGLELSSVSHESSASWEEVDSRGVHIARLGQILSDPQPESWKTLDDWVPGKMEEYVLGIGKFNMDVPRTPSNESIGKSVESVQTLRRHLSSSLALRVLGIPASVNPLSQDDTRLAILFSGGLDCSVLARLASDILPHGQGIDLINVAFENPRISRTSDGASALSDVYEACPDRVTGRASLAELQAACPCRPWRFIAVDVPYDQTVAHRSEVVSLMHPHNTEMDLSIARALYFASRAEGSALSVPGGTREPVTSPARVLLSGLGADELFGGYVRHATAFEKRGYVGLAEELRLDVSRLGSRNLGRDDRVMATWGREVRFPYLDEDLLAWAIECPAAQKCDFGSPACESGIEPGKKILRLLAEELGMRSVAREKKRAIQFGARTAKMESGKVKGTAVISL